MATIPERPRRRRGRPTREEEVRRTLAEIGCDPALVDPRRVLASIAADESMPPTARVAAARTLLGQRDQGPAETKRLQGKGRTGPRLSKRVLAARAAATAGGAWGDDLAWPDGRRPQ
jgi:hypothetical protein